MQVLDDLKTRDTIYLEVVNDLAFRLSMSDQERSIYYINLAISLSKDLNYERGIVRATTIKGNSFLITGMPDQALTYYLQALNHHPERYPLEYVRLNNNIGEVYRRKHMYDSSIKYFNRALNLAQEKIADYQPVIIYSNLGEASLMHGQVSKAEEFFKKCLANALESDHLRGQGYGYYGLAECAFLNGEVKSAIKWMKKSINVRLEDKHRRGVIQSYLKIGGYFNTAVINLPDSAVFYWQKTEDLASEYEAYDLLNEVYNRLYDFYFNNRDIANAAIYLNLHKHLDDSIKNAEFISNIGKIRSTLRSELIHAENELLKQESRQRKSEEDARLIVITLAFLIVLGLAAASYQYHRKQKAIIESKTESSFTQTLLSLSRDLNKDHLSVNSFIKKLLILSQEVLNCDRATYWQLDESTDSISLHSIAESDQSTQIPPVTFSQNELPKFFRDFLTNRTLSVSRISQDSRLSDIYENYFKKSGIESILNAPVLVNGNFIGFISYTMTNNQVREWNLQEQRYVGSLADLIVVAIGKMRGNILETEKEELIKKLRIRNKNLREFNSVISHNLREPLTQIIGLSDILKQDQSSGEESNEIISRISDSSNKVDKVIKELSIILSENDPKKGDFRLLSLERLIKEVMDLLKNEISTCNVTIEQDLKLSKLKSYKPYLTDAFYHLISNSLKFADPERRLHIKISSYEDDFKEYIIVSDNGKGMDLGRFGDKIFKMYQRYHLDIEGRGIGLFIVKNRINVLNGFISVESEEGIGTAFTIEFPKFISPLN